MTTRQATAEAGFTLIEILVVLGIIVSLLALTSINLGRPQTTASLQGTVDTLVADLKGQQLLAMAGDQGGGTTQQAHGIKIAGDHYSLFAGNSYDSGDANNFDTPVNAGVSFTASLPDGQLVFDTTSGEVHDFSDGHNTITVHAGDDSRTITINRLGTVTAE